jgi:hypothetical protein
MLRCVVEIDVYGYSHDWLEPPSFFWSTDLRDPIWEEDPEWRGEDRVVGFRYRAPVPEPLQAGALARHMWLHPYPSLLGHSWVEFDIREWLDDMPQGAYR